MDSVAQSALVSAVVGAIVGGVAGFVVARLQRTWDVETRLREDRRERIRAAVDVILKFLDAVEASRIGGASPSGSWRLSRPLDELSNADRWAVASVLRLFPDVTTWADFFYPPQYVMGGEVGQWNAAGGEWSAVRAHTGARLARLTAELEKLGDPYLRNLPE